MPQIDVTGMDCRAINERLRAEGPECTLTGCCGQRFIAAGMSEKRLTLEGIPGNALGAYLNGADITVRANAQDAVGDTMNDGTIAIFGSVGDAAGYAMRGGRILVRGSAGYRAGIHMKEYKDKSPLIIIGGAAGSFLGEYQAGGTIIVLGLDIGKKRIVGNFPGTGMHGGHMFLRGDWRGLSFPAQVTARLAGPEDMALIESDLKDYCRVFGLESGELLSSPYTVVTPDSSNPYHRMYVAN